MTKPRLRKKPILGVPVVERIASWASSNASNNPGDPPGNKEIPNLEAKIEGVRQSMRLHLTKSDTIGNGSDQNINEFVLMENTGDSTGNDTDQCHVTDIRNTDGWGDNPRLTPLDSQGQGQVSSVTEHIRLAWEELSTESYKDSIQSPNETSMESCTTPSDAGNII